MHRHIFIQIIGSLLIVLFTYAALSKLFDHAVFHAQLIKFPWIGSFAGLIAWLVPAMELITVWLLFFPRTVFYGFIVALVLLVLFTAFLCFMLVFSPSLPCSCGGVIALLSWKQHIAFNCFFMLITIAGIRLLKQQKHETGSQQQEIGII